MLLLSSPPLPPPVVPRLLRRASRWQPREGPREQGPGRRAPSPLRRVPVQPPPAAGDAATSRLSISRGSAAELPGLPLKVGTQLFGPRGCEGGQSAGGAALEPERASPAQASCLPVRGPAAGAEAAAGNSFGDRRGLSGGEGGKRGRAPASGRPGPGDCSAFGSLSGRRLGCRLWALREASADCFPARARSLLRLLPPNRRSGRAGYSSLDSSRRWVFSVWPCWPGAQKVSPLTSPETPPLRLRPAPGGPHWEPHGVGWGGEGSGPASRVWGRELGPQVHPARRGPSLG